MGKGWSMFAADRRSNSSTNLLWFRADDQFFVTPSSPRLRVSAAPRETLCPSTRCPALRPRLNWLLVPSFAPWSPCSCSKSAPLF